MPGFFDHLESVNISTLIPGFGAMVGFNMARATFSPVFGGWQLMRILSPMQYSGIFIVLGLAARAVSITTGMRDWIGSSYGTSVVESLGMAVLALAATFVTEGSGLGLTSLLWIGGSAAGGFYLATLVRDSWVYSRRT